VCRVCWYACVSLFMSIFACVRVSARMSRGSTDNVTHTHTHTHTHIGITLIGGVVLSSLFSATHSASGGRGTVSRTVSRNRQVSSSDWDKTARASRHIDKQVTTHCATLQHTATHCNTLQHTGAYCNTLQHTATQAQARTATQCNWHIDT